MPLNTGKKTKKGKKLGRKEEKTNPREEEDRIKKIYTNTNQ